LFVSFGRGISKSGSSSVSLLIALSSTTQIYKQSYGNDKETEMHTNEGPISQFEFSLNTKSISTQNKMGPGFLTDQ
jgi:hypothetical protein